LLERKVGKERKEGKESKEKKERKGKNTTHHRRQSSFNFFQVT